MLVVMLTLVLVLLPIVASLTASATRVHALMLSTVTHSTVVVLLVHFIAKIMWLNYLLHDGHDRLLL